MLFTRLLAHLPTFALPTQCAVCRGWGRERICAPCRRRFTPAVARCERCALQVPQGAAVCGACLKAPPPFDATLVAWDYGHPWDRLIGQFKFHAALDLALPFARSLADAWRASGSAHPGLLARELLGARSYKSDDTARQTPERLIARKELVDALEQGRTRLDVRLRLSAAQRDELAADASGDRLDAVLCLVQAAWASVSPHHGLPLNVDPLEGWIVSALHPDIES